MARWFPRADNKSGVNTALLVGFAGALIVVGIDAYGIVALLLRYQEYSAYGGQELAASHLLVKICLALIVVVAAWRFAIGKGLIWGSALLLLVVAPIFGYFFIAKTSVNIAWILIRFPVAAALVVGIGGAWAARKKTTTPPDYAGVFE